MRVIFERNICSENAMYDLFGSNAVVMSYPMVVVSPELTKEDALAALEILTEHLRKYYRCEGRISIEGPRELFKEDMRQHCLAQLSEKERATPERIQSLETTLEEACLKLYGPSTLTQGEINDDQMSKN